MGTTAWHGTRLAHDQLDVTAAMTRDGWAQHGSGLYFTSDPADALSYALPCGFIWRCEIDEDSVAETIQLGDGIIHHVVTNQSAILSATRHAITQTPPRKLDHRQRRTAMGDPDGWGLAIRPEIR